MNLAVLLLYKYRTKKIIVVIRTAPKAVLKTEDIATNRTYALARLDIMALPVRIVLHFQDAYMVAVIKVMNVIAFQDGMVFIATYVSIF